MDKIIVEVCVDSVESALAAQEGGADRVELCANLFEGGTTPSLGMTEAVRSLLSIGLHVIIRPRGGDFYYSDHEMDVIRRDILAAKKAGCDGVVAGFLKEDGSVDTVKTRQAVAWAAPMAFTFHRAFDMASEPGAALEAVIAAGAHKLLTSGQERSAAEGAALIAKLVRQAGNRIAIMAGGGVNEKNLRELVSRTGIAECHVSGAVKKDSGMVYRNHQVFMGKAIRLPEYENTVTDAGKIAAVVALSGFAHNNT